MSATHALVNIVSVDATSAGSLSAWSGSTAPANPAMRWRGPVAAIGRLVLVPLDSTSDIIVRPEGTAAHVIVDVVGYFT